MKYNKMGGLKIKQYFRLIAGNMIANVTAIKLCTYRTECVVHHSSLHESEVDHSLPQSCVCSKRYYNETGQSNLKTAMVVTFFKCSVSIPTALISKHSPTDEMYFSFQQLETFQDCLKESFKWSFKTITLPKFYLSYSEMRQLTDLVMFSLSCCQ